MNQLVNTQNETVSRWVTFTLEDEVYGIDVMQVREVLRYTDISPVPGAPPYVLGIINLRGKVVAIIDTRSRFDLPPTEPSDSSRILILEASDHVVGFLVDSVSEVAELKNDQIESAPDTGSGETNRFITGLYKRKDDLIILVDSNRLLSEDELAELASI
ncbi:MAG TPA: chemotaxis protein CheW [Gammaproteobacteria bacterium]|nr:chemotaxis protein CheW [Gammaproteobacteria bacterium]